MAYPSLLQHPSTPVYKSSLLMLLFSHSVVSDFLQPHGLQHTRLPCPSLFCIVCSNWCPLAQWCHPTISSFVTPFSSCPQSFPASGSFPMSQFFASGGQSIGASALTSVLSINIQGWFPLGLTGLIPLLSKGITHYSWVFSKKEKELQCSSKRTFQILCSIILPRNWQDHPFFV